MVVTVRRRAPPGMSYPPGTPAGQSPILRPTTHTRPATHTAIHTHHRLPCVIETAVFKIASILLLSIMASILPCPASRTRPAELSSVSGSRTLTLSDSIWPVPWLAYLCWRFLSRYYKLRNTALIIALFFTFLSLCVHHPSFPFVYHPGSHLFGATDFLNAFEIS